MNGDKVYRIKQGSSMRGLGYQRTPLRHLRPEGFGIGEKNAAFTQTRKG